MKRRWTLITHGSMSGRAGASGSIASGRVVEACGIKIPFRLWAPLIQAPVECMVAFVRKLRKTQTCFPGNIRQDSLRRTGLAELAVGGGIYHIARVAA